MGRPQRNDEPGVTHHVYCRGNRGERVFEDDRDYTAFIEKLRCLAEEMKVLVIAFCLMPNHFHLCVRTQPDGAKLSKFMQRLNLWHARRYNQKHQVRGRLNESRYKAKEVDCDAYLLTLVRYIHQNPQRAGLGPKVGDWEYSSHAAYLGTGHSWVATAEVLEAVGGVASYRAIVEGAQSQQEELELFRFKRREQLSLAHVRAKVADATGEERVRLSRACELWSHGLSLREIGQELGCDKSTVGRMFEAATCRETAAVYLPLARAA